MSVVVLISGRGSNLQALIEAGLPVAAVISNAAGAKGLEIARSHCIATRVIEQGRFASREAFEAALAAEIAGIKPRLIALAGFMRVLTPGFVQRHRERLLNIHPSLLPAFPGLDTHARALAAGVKLHGCSVHFVTAEVDHGPIVIQSAVRVRPRQRRCAGRARAGAGARRLPACRALVPRGPSGAAGWYRHSERQ